MGTGWYNTKKHKKLAMVNKNLLHSLQIDNARE